MTATLLDGTAFAALLRKAAAARAHAVTAKVGRPPGLAVVLVGEDPASAVYVRNKVKACAEVGVASYENYLPVEVAQAGLESLVRELNERREIDGILIQSPLPKPLKLQPLLELIDPVKDVDGFTTHNAGRLFQGRPAHVACTPAGVMRLLEHHRVPLAGKRAVVVGRSNIVGRPMAQLLQLADATVTVVHSRTDDLPARVHEAEIVVAAMGRPAALGPDHFAAGAIAVDVGINRVTDFTLASQWFAGDAKRLAAFEKHGVTLVGDIDPRAWPKLAAYTPVPGGVGPLTIAMLMQNTVAAAEHRAGIKALF